MAVLPGSETTEFKLSVIISSLLSLAGAFKYIDPQVAAQLVAGVVGVYTAGRTVVKSFATKAAA